MQVDTPLHRKIAVTAVCIIAAIYYLPVIGVSLSLNYPYWDAFSIPFVCLKPPEYGFKPILANLIYSVFTDKIQYRPTSVFIMNMNYLLFGGEFWAWYLVRWTVFFTTACLLYRFLIRLTSFLPAITATAFFLFHQEPFVTDVMATDAYAAFFSILVLYYLAKTCSGAEQFFDLSSRTWLQRTLLFIAWTLASGSKEIVISLLASLLLGFAATWLRRRPSITAALFWLLLCVPVGYAAYKIKSLDHPCVGPSILKEGWSKPVRDYYWWTAANLAPHAEPPSPSHFLLYAGIVVFVVGVLASLYRPWRLLMISVLMTALGLCTMMLFQTGPYTKYLPLPILLIACILGLCLASIKDVIGLLLARRPALLHPGIVGAMACLWVVGCLSYAACTISDTYTQYLGMMQTADEMAEITNFMEQHIDQGYTCAVTGIGNNPHELPPEKGGDFKLYFERFGQELYERPTKTRVLTLAAEGPAPPGPFVLLTSIEVDRVAAGELRDVGVADLSRLEDVFQFNRSRYGFFERVVKQLKRFDERIGNTHEAAIGGQLPQPSRFGKDMPNPTHDILWYPQQAGPHYLYVFGAEHNRDPKASVSVKSLQPFRRYGAYGR